MAKTIHSFYAVGMFAFASLAALALAPDSSAVLSLHVVRVDDPGDATVIPLDPEKVEQCPGFAQALETAARDGEVFLGRRTEYRCPAGLVLGEEWGGDLGSWNGTVFQFQMPLG